MEAKFETVDKKMIDVRRGYDTIIENKREADAVKYVCNVCGYEYDEEAGDPDNGIEPGTKFEDLPEDWICPLCGVGKDEFSEA